MGCGWWATLPVEAGNERLSANGGVRSVGLRPGAAGNVESEAGRRPKADKDPLLKREATTWLLLFLVDYSEKLSNLF